jgi:hypothetical protein
MSANTSVTRADLAGLSRRCAGASFCSVPENEMGSDQLKRLLARGQEPGVAQAVATLEAIEKAYFDAVLPAPQVIVATSYATTTSPR